MSKKSEDAAWAVEVATSTLNVYNDIRNVWENHFANGYNTGDTQMQDADIADDETLAHLSAAEYTSVIVVIEAVKTLLEADGRLAALRRAASGGPTDR